MSLKEKREQLRAKARAAEAAFRETRDHEYRFFASIYRRQLEEIQ